MALYPAVSPTASQRISHPATSHPTVSSAASQPVPHPHASHPNASQLAAVEPTAAYSNASQSVSKPTSSQLTACCLTARKSLPSILKPSLPACVEAHGLYKSLQPHTLWQDHDHTAFMQAPASQSTAPQPVRKPTATPYHHPSASQPSTSGDCRGPQSYFPAVPCPVLPCKPWDSIVQADSYAQQTSDATAQQFHGPTRRCIPSFIHFHGPTPSCPFARHFLTDL